MRRYLIILSVFVVFIFATGMGVGGPTNKIPTPTHNFSATIIDSEGVTTKVTNISFDGKTFLAGQRGNATVTVPFEKIASVQVGQPEENKYVSAIVTLKEGGTLNLKVEGKMPCYGSAEFGNVQIEFKDIKKIHIEGLAGKEKK